MDESQGPVKEARHESAHTGWFHLGESFYLLIIIIHVKELSQAIVTEIGSGTCGQELGMGLTAERPGSWNLCSGSPSCWRTRGNIYENCQTVYLK